MICYANIALKKNLIGLSQDGKNIRESRNQHIVIRSLNLKLEKSTIFRRVVAEHYPTITRSFLNLSMNHRLRNGKEWNGLERKKRNVKLKLQLVLPLNQLHQITF